MRNATPADAEAICEIYNHYVKNSTVTFQVAPVQAGEMRLLIAETMKKYPWLVEEVDGRVVAYAHAVRWKGRCAYEFSAEASVYVAHDHAGRGLGKPLYLELIDRLKAQGIHSIIAGIALPNPVSVTFHEKLGFRKCGEFTEVGRKFGQWLNVGYWELLTESQPETGDSNG